MTTDYQFPASPPKESLDFFRAKKLRVGFSHQDVFREEHATAFTVAKAMNLEVLETIRGEVDRALAEGRTFAQFQKDLRPRLEAQGWWGEKRVLDPLTGKKRLSQLGSPRRLETIYRTNMRTSRAAGQWDRIERTKAALPYLLYELGPSEKHREEHVRWAGTLLPVTDPFWKTHFAPNGWGCKCRVRQVGKAEYSRLSSSGRYNLKAPPVETREWVNKRTGEVTRVPKGIDPGWDYNPGMVSREARALDLMSEKLQVADAGVARETLTGLTRSNGFKQWYEKPDGNFPVARLPAADVELLQAKRSVVQLSQDTALKQRANHPELKFDEYAFVQQAVDIGERIQDAGSLIYVLEDGGYVAIVKATLSGKALFLTSFRRLSAVQAKRDRELQRLRSKKGGE